MTAHSSVERQAASTQKTAVSEAMSPWHFDHLSVSVGADDALRTLFEGVMGFKTGFRPPFPFPGRWLYAGEQAVVHAIDDASLSADASQVRFNHIAFNSPQPASQVIAQLQSTGLPFKVARIPQDDVAQIFVQLPGNFVVELDVPDDTEGPAGHVYSASRGAPTSGDF